MESSVEIVETAFNVLKEDGRVVMHLQQTFFSPSYGIVIDKFGVMWNLAGHGRRIETKSLYPI